MTAPTQRNFRAEIHDDIARVWAKHRPKWSYIRPEWIKVSSGRVTPTVDPKVYGLKVPKDHEDTQIPIVISKAERSQREKLNFLLIALFNLNSTDFFFNQDIGCTEVVLGALGLDPIEVIDQFVNPPDRIFGYSLPNGKVANCSDQSKYDKLKKLLCDFEEAMTKAYE